MLGLADYGSSGEEDNTPQEQGLPSSSPSSSIPKRPSVAPVPPATTNTSKPSGKGKAKPAAKKKPRITVAILPPDIQAALARGGNLDSEDEEEETEEEAERRRKLRAQAESARAAGKSNGGKGAGGLFALLPKPKAEQEAAAVVAKAVGGARVKEAGVVEEKMREEGIEDGKSEKKEEDREGSGSGSDSDSDEEGTGGGGLGLLHPSLLAATKAPPPKPPVMKLTPTTTIPTTTATPSLPATARESVQLAPSPPSAAPTAWQAPSPSSIDHSHQQQHQYDYSTYYQQQHPGYGGADASQQQQQAYYQQYYGGAYPADYHQQEQQPPQEQQPGVEDEFGTGVGRGGKRRDKKLMRELEAGNVEALSKVGGQAVEVAPHNEPWNPFKYGAQKKQEKVKIQAAFYDAGKGETTTTTNVSRTHRSKHHINTLAIQALEREQDLLEGRSKQMLTKAQTQGRYGW